MCKIVKGSEQAKCNGILTKQKEELDLRTPKKH